jgi:glucans biosynthesis protein C
MGDGSLARLHYLDALRGFAMVLVVPWHAAAFFTVRDQGGTLLVGWMWVAHSFRMPLFFLLAGFFGTLTVDRRGTAEWMRGRLTRIGVPLAVGTAVLIPLSGLFATWQAQEAHGSLLTRLTHPTPEYLWFLWYLLIVIVVWLALRGVARRWSQAAAIRRRLHGIAASDWAIPALAIPCALAVWLTGTWGPYPPNDFAAPAGLLAYYAIFFAFGLFLGGCLSALDSLGRNPYRRLAVATVVACPAFWLFAHAGDSGIAGDPLIRLGALYLGALCCWLLIAGLVGLFRKFLSRERPVVRYVADSSYWIYLSHMLFLAPIQLLLIGLVIPGALKFTLAVAATFALTLVTYQLFVRYTAIGRVLDSPRSRTPAPPPGAGKPIPRSEMPVSRPAAAAGR